MIIDEELDKLEQERSEKLELIDHNTEKSMKTAEEVVNEQEQAVLTAVKQTSKFQSMVTESTENSVEAEIEKRNLIVAGKKQENELAKLQLKLNKKTMKDEARAAHYERKRKAKMVRYGYLYTPYEVEIIDTETGELKKETRYKNFTTNNFINHYKEFANFYANLADGTKSIITKTLKIVFWVLLLVGIGFGIYGIIKWIINSGILNNIVGSTEQIVHYIY